MITNSEITRLLGLTSNLPRLLKYGESALFYSTWFVLELPEKMFDVNRKFWVDDPPEQLTQWKEKYGQGEASYGQPVSFKGPTDQVPLIKLISDNGTALIEASLYRLIVQEVDEPEFRVFPEAGLPVAVWSHGSLLGVIGQVNI